MDSFNLIDLPLSTARAVDWQWARRMQEYPATDCTGMAPGRRRQRDADRRRQARADGHGAINDDMVALCRSGTRQAAADRAARMRQGPGDKVPQSIRRRWGVFLLQTGRGRLTTAQARSLRRRSTRAELWALSPNERRMIGLPR